MIPVLASPRLHIAELFRQHKLALALELLRLMVDQRFLARYVGDARLDRLQMPLVLLVMLGLNEHLCARQR